jgi:hypothetical protein
VKGDFYHVNLSVYFTVSLGSILKKIAAPKNFYTAPQRYGYKN